LAKRAKENKAKLLAKRIKEGKKLKEKFKLI
jgi:hypothetical protein